MLATGATVTNSTAVDGAVIANGISSTGELHSHTLGATGQSFTPSFGSVPVPEPCSLAALAASLLGLVAARQMRSKPVPALTA